MRIKFFFLLILLFTSLPACVKQNGNGSCARGVAVSFYSQSRCQSVPLYPANIENIDLYVFDEQGILRHTERLTGVVLSNDFFQKVDLAPGLYSMVAWAGIDPSLFDLNIPIVGTTTKDDLLFRLQRTSRAALSLDGTRIYFGENPAVLVEAGNTDRRYKQAKLNLLEITNRITINVEGLAGDMDNYSVSIQADNASMNMDGTIASDVAVIYSPVYVNQEDMVVAEFEMLKLETGYEYTLSITNNITGQELFNGSLLEALILKNPYVDLLCHHDFTITFTAEDQCDCGTYVIAEIRVNEWLVHSYGTDI